MTAEELIPFFASGGSDVACTASCWWNEEQRGRRVYHSFPFHRLINPPPAEISEVFRRLPGAVAIRFLMPAQSTRKQSFIWVRRRPYELEVLSPKSRNQTRRGIEACEVKKMGWQDLLATAHEAHGDTIDRHGSQTGHSLGFDEALANCPAYEAWGAFLNGKLAAYSITLSVDDWVYILLQRSATAHLKARPNNALVFCMVKELLSRPNTSTVTFGVEPLTPLGSLEHFKLGMGFVKEPVSQRIVLAPRLRLIVNPITAKPIEIIAALMPKGSRFQKLAGFCRVASHG